MLRLSSLLEISGLVSLSGLMALSRLLVSLLLLIWVCRHRNNLEKLGRNFLTALTVSIHLLAFLSLLINSGLTFLEPASAQDSLHLVSLGQAILTRSEVGLTSLASYTTMRHLTR